MPGAVKTVGLLMVAVILSGCVTAVPGYEISDGGLVFMPPEVEVEMALSAGPEHIRAKAAVYVFGESGYRMVRESSNGFTCLVNRDGFQNGDSVLRPTCWDAEGTKTIVSVVLRVGDLIAKGVSSVEIENDINLGFQTGKFINPKRAGIAYMLRGDVLVDAQTGNVADTVFPPHYMIYAPGVGNEDIGMTPEAYQNNPSLPVVYDGYTGGSRIAYIIVMAKSQVEQ